MNACICCNSKLLRHLDRHRIYWFCPHCYREMPNTAFLRSSERNKIIKVKVLQKAV